MVNSPARNILPLKEEHIGNEHLGKKIEEEDEEDDEEESEIEQIIRRSSSILAKYGENRMPAVANSQMQRAMPQSFSTHANLNFGKRQRKKEKTEKTDEDEEEDEEEDSDEEIFAQHSSLQSLRKSKSAFAGFLPGGTARIHQSTAPFACPIIVKEEDEERHTDQADNHDHDQKKATDDIAELIDLARGDVLQFRINELPEAERSRHSSETSDVMLEPSERAMSRWSAPAGDEDEEEEDRELDEDEMLGEEEEEEGQVRRNGQFLTANERKVSSWSAPSRFSSRAHRQRLRNERESNEKMMKNPEELMRMEGRIPEEEMNREEKEMIMKMIKPVEEEKSMEEINAVEERVRKIPNGKEVTGYGNKEEEEDDEEEDEDEPRGLCMFNGGEPQNIRNLEIETKDGEGMSMTTDDEDEEEEEEGEESEKGQEPIVVADPRKQMRVFVTTSNNHHNRTLRRHPPFPSSRSDTQLLWWHRQQPPPPAPFPLDPMEEASNKKKLPHSKTFAGRRGRDEEEDEEEDGWDEYGRKDEDEEEEDEEDEDEPTLNTVGTESPKPIMPTGDDGHQGEFVRSPIKFRHPTRNRVPYNNVRDRVRMSLPNPAMAYPGRSHHHQRASYCGEEVIPMVDDCPTPNLHSLPGNFVALPFGAGQHHNANKLLLENSLTSSYYTEEDEEGGGNGGGEVGERKRTRKGRIRVPVQRSVAARLCRRGSPPRAQCDELSESEISDLEQEIASGRLVRSASGTSAAALKEFVEEEPKQVDDEDGENDRKNNREEYQIWREDDAEDDRMGEEKEEDQVKDENEAEENDPIDDRDEDPMEKFDDDDDDRKSDREEDRLGNADDEENNRMDAEREKDQADEEDDDVRMQVEIEEEKEEEWESGGSNDGPYDQTIPPDNAICGSSSMPALPNNSYWGAGYVPASFWQSEYPAEEDGSWEDGEKEESRMMMRSLTVQSELREGQVMMNGGRRSGRRMLPLRPDQRQKIASKGTKNIRVSKEEDGRKEEEEEGEEEEELFPFTHSLVHRRQLPRTPSDSDPLGKIDIASSTKEYLLSVLHQQQLQHKTGNMKEEQQRRQQKMEPESDDFSPSVPILPSPSTIQRPNLPLYLPDPSKWQDHHHHRHNDPSSPDEYKLSYGMDQSVLRHARRRRREPLSIEGSYYEDVVEDGLNGNLGTGGMVFYARGGEEAARGHWTDDQQYTPDEEGERRRGSVFNMVDGNKSSSGISSCCTTSSRSCEPENGTRMRYKGKKEVVDPADPSTPTHRAQFPFMPRHADEIRLDRGDALHIVEKFEDHWCYGTNLRTGKQGIFPEAHIVEIDLVDEICSSMLPDNISRKLKYEQDTFYLTMMASVEVAHHKGNDVLIQAINKVCSTYQQKEEILIPQTILMEVSFRGIHLIDKRKKDIFRCPTFDYFYSLQNISFCGAHPQELRYFGFITKHPLLPRFACHVFLSTESTQPIVEAIGRAFKRSYDEYMAFAHPTEDIFIE